MIPYSRQDIGEDDIRAVVKVLRSPFLTQGPAIASFENALSKKAGALYCVAFNSGTAALHAAYATAGIGPGDEVIVPALTFAATGNAALYLGARPVFADIDLATGLIDIGDVQKKITAKTKAIVPVDYAGRPANLRALRSLAKKHKLLLIEDAAHSLGGSYEGRPIGAQADMTMFSFHPVKSITTGEGGAIVTDKKDFYEKLLMFRSHGLTKNPALLRVKDRAAWHQEMHMLGFNYRMTDMQAALGQSQLKRLDSFITKRRSRAVRYETLLRKTPGLILPPADTIAARSAWHLYPVRLPPESAHLRDAIFTALRERGIGVQVHYLPVYLHPYYAALGYKKGLCPNAEIYSFSELSLPLFPALTNREQDLVAKTLAELLSEMR